MALMKLRRTLRTWWRCSILDLIESKKLLRNWSKFTNNMGRTTTGTRLTLKTLKGSWHKLRPSTRAFPAVEGCLQVLVVVLRVRILMEQG